jgi:hypothetical protein
LCVLCSNIEEKDLVLSEVQLLPVADEAESPTMQPVEITIKEDIDDEDDDDEYADEDSSFNPAVYIGSRMQFSTELIVQKFARNISTSSKLMNKHLVPAYFWIIWLAARYAAVVHIECLAIKCFQKFFCRLRQ